MPICPFAVWRPLPEQGHQRAVVAKRLAIIHSADGESTSLYNFFKNSTELESHFFIAVSGVIEQYLDTDQRADANRLANDEAISIETGDHGDPDNVPWNAAQEQSIIRLLDWICNTHPRVTRERATAPDGHGIGWHTMWGAPSAWTPIAKSCPGRVRKLQMPEIISQVANYEGDEMSAECERQVQVLYDVFAGEQPNDPSPDAPPRRVKVLDNAMWTKERVNAAYNEAHAAAVLAGNCNTMLDAIMKHFNIELPVEPPEK